MNVNACEIAPCMHAHYSPLLRVHLTRFFFPLISSPRPIRSSGRRRDGRVEPPSSIASFSRWTLHSLSLSLCLSLSLVQCCSCCPFPRPLARSPLPSSSSSPPRTTRSVTRERQETNGGPRRRSPFTRHSPHDGRPPPSLPPFHGGGQRQRDSRRGQRSEGSAARGLPACQGRRRLPGRIGAAARPWATSVCFGIWGQSHTLGGAALSLALPLRSSDGASEAVGSRAGPARDMFTSCQELHPSPVVVSLEIIEWRHFETF